MTTHEALTAQLCQLQRAIYDHEFEGAFTMSSREAEEYRAELNERKAALLAEIGTALENEAHPVRPEAIETMVEVER